MDIDLPRSWDEFSNTRFESRDAGWGKTGCGSIEAPHNTVHVLLGGLGHMANADYAGFDPIFYLHHCNVDRILAFWEHTYHKYWIDYGYYEEGGNGNPIPFTQVRGTWGEANDAQIDKNAALQPFRTKDGEYWTADQTRFSNKGSIFDTGYTYPDIVAAIGGKQHCVKLSDPLPDSDAKVREAKTIIQAHFGVNQKPAVLKREHTIDYGVPEGHSFVPRYHHFYLFVELVAHAFGGSYSLEVLYKKRVVGTFAVFARGDATQCAACRIRREEGEEVRGIVDIPDETLHDIDESVEPGDDLLEALAREIKDKVTIRLVDAGGNLLADTDASLNAPGLRPSRNNDGRRLEEAIAPKVRLWSEGALRKDSEADNEVTFGSDLTYFDHKDHGDLLSGPDTWVPR